jgi:hypothetical protein
MKNVKLIFEDTYNLLQNSIRCNCYLRHCHVGTALFKVPQIVVYKANALT